MGSVVVLQTNHRGGQKHQNTNNYPGWSDRFQHQPLFLKRQIQIVSCVSPAKRILCEQYRRTCQHSNRPRSAVSRPRLLSQTFLWHMQKHIHLPAWWWLLSSAESTCVFSSLVGVHGTTQYMVQSIMCFCLHWTLRTGNISTSKWITSKSECLECWAAVSQEHDACSHEIIITASYYIIKLQIPPSAWRMRVWSPIVWRHIRHVHFTNLNW